MRSNIGIFKWHGRVRPRWCARLCQRVCPRAPRLLSALGCAVALAVPVGPALVGIDSWFVAGMVASIYALAATVFLLGDTFGAWFFKWSGTRWRIDVVAMANSWVVALLMTAGFAGVAVLRMTFPVVAVPIVVAGKVVSCFAGGLALGASRLRMDKERSNGIGETASGSAGEKVSGRTSARGLSAPGLFVAAGAAYCTLVIAESVALSISGFWLFCLRLAVIAPALLLSLSLYQLDERGVRDAWSNVAPALLGVSVTFCMYRVIVPFDTPEALPLWAASVTVLLGAMALAKRFNCIDEPVDEDSAPRAPSFHSAGALDIDELEPALMSVLDERGLTARERAALLATCRGFTSEEVAVELGIKAATVRSYLQRAYRKLGVASFKVFRETYATQLEKKLSAVDERNSCTAEGAFDRSGGAGDMLAYALRLLVAVNVLALLLVFSDTAGVFSAVFRNALFTGALVGVVALTLISGVRPFGKVGACVALVGHVVLLARLASFGFAATTGLSYDAVPGLEAVVGGVAGFGVGWSLGGVPILRMDVSDNVDASLHALRASCVVVGVYVVAAIVPSVWVVVMILVALVAIGADVALLRGSVDEPACDAQKQPSVTRAAFGDALSSALASGALSLALLGGVSVASAVCAFLSVMLVVVGQLVFIKRVWGSDVAVSAVGLCAIVLLANVLRDIWLARVDFPSLLGVFGCVSLLLGVFHATAVGACAADGRRGIATGLAFGAAAAFMLCDILWISEAVRYYSGIEAAWSNMVSEAFETVLVACVFLAGGVVAFQGLFFDHAAVAHSLEDGDEGLERVRHLLMAHGLNQTEVAVLIEIARGSNGSHIARELSYSKGAVNSARRTGYRKLRIHGRGQLVELLEDFSREEAAGAASESRCVESGARDEGIV